MCRLFCEFFGKFCFRHDVLCVSNIHTNAKKKLFFSAKYLTIRLYWITKNDVCAWTQVLFSFNILEALKGEIHKEKWWLKCRWNYRIRFFEKVNWSEEKNIRHMSMSFFSVIHSIISQHTCTQMYSRLSFISQWHALHHYYLTQTRTHTFQKSDNFSGKQ